MTDSSIGPPLEQLLNPQRLAPSAAILGAHIALSAALGTHGVGGTNHDQQTIDLLLRLTVSSDTSRAVDLAEQLMVSASHMSRVLDKVQALGLVERLPDPADRRANKVVITEAGSNVVATVAPHLAATLDRVIHNTLDSGEIETLIDLLGRIEQAARTPTPNQPRSAPG